MTTKAPHSLPVDEEVTLVDRLLCSGLSVWVMTVMAVMTMVGRLSERSCGHTKDHEEEESDLFHNSIVDANT